MTGAGYLLQTYAPTNDMAVPFTPTSDLRLDRVVLALDSYQTQVDVMLLADEGGVPGAILELVGTTDALQTFNANELVTLTPSSGYLLRAGTPYWISANGKAGTLSSHWYAPPGITESGWVRRTNGGPWQAVSGPQPGLKVHGSAFKTPSLGGNLAPTWTYNSSLGLPVRGSGTALGEISRAVVFQPATDARLQSVSLALLKNGPLAVDSVHVELHLETGAGSPGSFVVEDLGVVSGLPEFGTTATGITEIQSQSGPMLLAANHYWLVCTPADPDTDVVWADNAALSSGLAFTSTGGPWVFSFPIGLAYQVTGIAHFAENYCQAGTSAGGCTPQLQANGVPSASASSGFTVSATALEGGKDGIFFYSSNGRQQQPWGNGSSFQCVVPPVKRAGLVLGSGTAGQCDGALVQDLNELWWSNPPKSPGSGALVQIQAWYRDPFSTSNQTTSMTDASEFTVAP